MASDERASPFTTIAQEAFGDLDALVREVVADIASIPLGVQTVPASTRRGRQQRQADELADLLAGLSAKFGPQQVLDVLDQPVPEQDGKPLLEALVGEYGEDVVRQAFALLAPRLRELQGTPAHEQFLPAVAEAGQVEGDPQDQPRPE